MPFVERDVSVDQVAAQEMVRRSGQMGVPVITAGDEVIVGFDRPRLERIATAYASGAPSGPGRPKLGLTVRDVAGNVEVGGVRPGALGERAGVRPGDIVERLAGEPVHSVDELERVARSLQPGQRVPIVVRRAGQHLILSAG